MSKKWLYLAAAQSLCFAVYAQQPSIVKVKPGFATVIVCPAQPELVTVGNQEQFSVQSAGTYVLVKPLVDHGSTNMFIKSGPDSYNLVLQISDRPDLEVRLQPAARAAGTLSAGDRDGKPGTKLGESLAPVSSAGGAQSLLSPKARKVLSAYLKTPRPYTYSVANSDIVFAVDHMTMIEGRLHLICTLVNNSKIPYDVGYVRFKLIEHARSYLFFKKRIKQEELEPVREFYSSRVDPGDSTRLLFVFEKHGFSDKSILEIKCNEEGGRRDLTIKVPGSFVE